MLRMVAQAACKDPVPSWARQFADPEFLADQGKKRARAAGSADTILNVLSSSEALADTMQPTQREQQRDHDDTQAYEPTQHLEPLPDRQADSARDDTSIDGEPLDVADAGEPLDVADAWMFGWCPHAKKAFRHPPDQAGSREYTDRLVRGSHADSAPTAHWPDGTSWAVSAITSRCIPDQDAAGQPGLPAEAASELEMTIWEASATEDTPDRAHCSR